MECCREQRPTNQQQQQIDYQKGIAFHWELPFVSRIEMSFPTKSPQAIAVREEFMLRYVVLVVRNR